MLIDDQARHQPKDIGRASLWTPLEVEAGDDLLRRRGDRGDAVTLIGGSTEAIERLANDLISVKGVRYGQLVRATIGKTLA